MERISRAKCVDFDDLINGTNYKVSDEFISRGIKVRILPFQWQNSTWFSEGHATVENKQQSGGSKLEIFTNNVNLGFRFGHLKYGVKFLFFESGGNLNMEINKDLKNFRNFLDLNSTTLGGVTINVIQSPDSHKGVIELLGDMKEFKFLEQPGKFALIVGGQELFIDKVCPLTKNPSENTSS